MGTINNSKELETTFVKMSCKTTPYPPYTERHQVVLKIKDMLNLVDGSSRSEREDIAIEIYKTFKKNPFLCRTRKFHKVADLKAEELLQQSNRPDLVVMLNDWLENYSRKYNLRVIPRVNYA